METSRLNLALIPALPALLFATLASGADWRGHQHLDAIHAGDAAMQSDRYLYLGDSYTIGTGVKREQGWPALLQQRLLDANQPLGKATVFARNGWTTTELLLALHHAIPITQYQHVFLMIGVNDQYQGLPEAGVWLRWSRLIETAIGFSACGARGVSVISIPDWSYSPWGRRFSSGNNAAGIDVYNEQGKRLSAKAGVQWIDVTPLSRDTHPATDFVQDGLHPSAHQYQRWVDEAIFPTLESQATCTPHTNAAHLPPH